MATPPVQQAQYRRIADGIRGQIIDGTWTTGMQLPATDKLAGTWGTSYGTVHSALQKLVKEGWIERLDGAGTFVADYQNRFVSAGIYHCTDIFADEQNGFARSLHTLLIKRLAARGKKSMVFVESGTEKERSGVLPELHEAIRLRRIQCVIAPTAYPSDMASLASLRVPTAFIDNIESPNQVVITRETLLRGTIRALAQKGCRTIGFITHVDTTGSSPADRGYQKRFEQIVWEEGLTTDRRWITRPASVVLDLERFGYREFRTLWSLPERPDGLVVYPDVVARGVIAAVLELGVREVASRVKFAFHRNASPLPLCPFPATWAVLNIEEVADAALRLLDRQFAGEKTGPVNVDHSIEDSGPLI